MSEVLTFADYSEPDWGEIELSEDWASYRKFWAAVLQFAAADQADAVVFDLDLGEECLATVIGDKTYAMNPPPIEYGDCLLAAARRLAVGGPLRGAVRCLLRIWDQSHYLGQVVLQIPGHEVKWNVYALSNGLRMQRLARTA